jgi:mannose-6-phosphate isomerase-like protein (cupin superfamily)
VAAASVRTPLSTWFADAAAVACFRRERLGRAPHVLPPRDPAWRTIAPTFAGVRQLAASGLPFHVVAHGRDTRSSDGRRLRRALAAGDTVFLPQVHQILPRLARLMVALRVGLLGPRPEECSFMFLVEGRGRPGMGVHHDGAVDSFWLQLEGRRTVTIGPPVPAGTPEELRGRAVARGPGWRTLELTPGTLFYLPPRTPHDVVCHRRSLALSLTWRPRRRGARRRVRTNLPTWDVVSGQVERRPRSHHDRVWIQVPTITGRRDRARKRQSVHTPDGTIWLPASARSLAPHLDLMPNFPPQALPPRWIQPLRAHGILAPHDLPQLILPASPAALDAWKF